MKGPTTRRTKRDRFGISVSWDSFMVSGMQKSATEFWRILYTVKQLQTEYPDLYASLRGKAEKRARQNGMTLAEAIEEALVAAHLKELYGKQQSSPESEGVNG